MHYINCGDRATWLETRRRFIGASDTAAILGCGYSGQNDITVWDDKVWGRTNEFPEKRLMIGTLIQPALLAIAQMETGWQVRPEDDYTIRVSDDVPFLAASLDGWITDSEEEVPLELKNVSNFARSEWMDEPPLKHQIQVQHQLAVTGCSHGYLFGLLSGDEPVIRRIDRNDAFISEMIRKLSAFWGYVERKELPIIDGSGATSEVILRLHPRDFGYTITLPPDVEEWHKQRMEADADLDDAKVRKTEAENKIKAAIGDASIGELPGVCRYSWKKQTRAEYVCKATEFRVLRVCK